MKPIPRRTGVFIKAHLINIAISMAAFVTAFSLISITYGNPGTATAGASVTMPVTQQNALVQRYCEVCHNDAHLNGGLSFEHFDAAHPDPGVAAMIISKIAAGFGPQRIQAAHADPAIAAGLNQSIKTGAINAAGVPVPDIATMNTFLSALATEAVGANRWTVNGTVSRSGSRTQNTSGQSAMLTVSSVQEAPSTAYPGGSDLYRLTLACRVDTHQGEIQIAWAPDSPAAGREMSVAVDGSAPLTYKIETGEKMFKGAVGTMGTGAVVLYTTQDNGSLKLPTPLPSQTLTISNLFPNETPVFNFADLPQTTRRQLSTCFSGSAHPAIAEASK